MSGDGMTGSASDFVRTGGHSTGLGGAYFLISAGWVWKVPHGCTLWVCHGLSELEFDVGQHWRKQVGVVTLVDRVLFVDVFVWADTVDALWRSMSVLVQCRKSFNLVQCKPVRFGQHAFSNNTLESNELGLLTGVQNCGSGQKEIKGGEKEKGSGEGVK
ncbi:hypothetical protein HPP92_020505 [Vanilla planifolia]|uniref:Uncharacterized protein n=1 Tax=Vanilla planifolia TaxID=51239 RepID=A0A835Q2U8_VANPL|nr:hypothetical protein HPP92_020505 [Vanilla planifolia]